MDPLRRPYRILALDGGGTFCLIQAKVLADLYPGMRGREILRQFDLVAGCSGGAIVTAALIDDKTPVEILDLFLRRSHRERLFSDLPWQRRLIYQATRTLHRIGLVDKAFGPRFSTDRKLAFLHDVLPNAGRTPLRDVAALFRDAGGKVPDFMFVTYDFDHDRTKMLRTQLDSRAANFPHADGMTTVAEAVHASSTAPINWFQEPARLGGRRYWDGAMTSYNNPVLAAVTEALAQGVPAEEIQVLSIGTSTVFPKPQENDGFVDDLVKLANLVVTDPPDAHSFIAHVALGGKLPASASECPSANTAIIRMNPVVQKVYDPQSRRLAWPEAWAEDDLQRLIDMDIAATADADVELICRLADEWLADGWNNQPIRTGGRVFAAQDGSLGDLTDASAHAILCEIGHPRYRQARHAWQAMQG